MPDNKESERILQELIIGSVIAINEFNGVTVKYTKLENHPKYFICMDGFCCKRYFTYNEIIKKGYYIVENK